MITQLSAHGFAQGGDGLGLLGAGWAAPELTGVWSVARNSHVLLPAPAGCGALALEIELDSQLEHAVTRHRRIAISLNGRQLDERRIGGVLQWHIDVPRDAPASALKLAFRNLNYSAADRCGIRLRRIGVLRNTHAPLPAPVRDLAETHFSWNDDTEALLGEGWGTPEDAYVWAVGPISTLRVPVPRTGVPMLALLDMHPFIRPPLQPRQRVVISVDGAIAVSIELQERLTVAVDVRPRPGQDSVVLGFRNLDADFAVTDPIYHFGKPFAWFLSSLRLVPALPRFLPGARPRLPGGVADGSLQLCVEMLTGMKAAALVERFEGLGNGCELGLLQQSLGHDRSGLLRFAAIRQRELVEGLWRGFQGVARLERLKWEIRREEDDSWRLIEESFGVSSATPHPRDQPPPGFRLESRRLPRLADKLMEDVAAGEKIFVLRISEPHDEAAAMAALAALRHFGDADMIWLVTDGSQPPGSVERLACGLIRGHLESPLSGRPISPDTMLSALANALILLRQAMPLPPDWAPG